MPDTSRLFRLWFTDDQLHGIFASYMDWFFGPSGEIVEYRTFALATVAIKTLLEANNANVLPHVALVDIHFKETGEEAEYVLPEEDTFRGDLINRIEKGDCQYGIMVAAEIRAAEQRLGASSPVDMVLFTANPNVRSSLGWVAAPSPKSGISLVPVIYNSPYAAERGD